MNSPLFRYEDAHHRYAYRNVGLVGALTRPRHLVRARSDAHEDRRACFARMRLCRNRPAPATSPSAVPVLSESVSQLLGVFESCLTGAPPPHSIYISGYQQHASRSKTTKGRCCHRPTRGVLGRSFEAREMTERQGVRPMREFEVHVCCAALFRAALKKLLPASSSAP